MSNLKKFKANEINGKNVKGGTNFCEWYITQRADKHIAPGQMAIAMELDQIAATEGLSAAMEEGGTAFVAQWS